MTEIRSLLDGLAIDAWRSSNPFSNALQTTQEALLAPTVSDAERVKALHAWLAKEQPCVFGRMSARAGALAVGFLTEADIAKGDAYLSRSLQEIRRDWTRASFTGRASGLVVVMLSRRLATAEPSPVVAEIARRFASMYLLEDVSFDTIYLDEAFLEVPGPDRMTFCWPAGVNYFASNGDGRWWSDHRIPGGIALSINSVGHMAKTGKLREALALLHADLGLPPPAMGGARLATLPAALELAMRTISRSADTVSGRSTWLAPLAEASTAGVGRPPELAKDLDAFDHLSYRGWYHTDVTLPSEYFRPDIERPSTVTLHTLDLSYLVDSRPDNYDFVRMGEGRLIRAVDPLPITAHRSPRRLQPSLFSIDDSSRLRTALKEPGSESCDVSF